MINFKDRVPQKPNVYSSTQNQDGTVTIVRADEPLVNGTILNRETLMDLQGWTASTTEFGLDGTITDTYGNGVTVITSFPDGLISRETMTDGNGDVCILETFINEQGQIEKRLV